MRLLPIFRFSFLFPIFLIWTTYFIPTTVIAQALTFQIEEETVKMGEEMCTDVLVQDFDLIGFQFTISWDSTVLEFTRVINAKIPYFLQSSYQEFPNMFRVAWINENISSSVTLPDNSPVFTLCFTPKKSGGSTLYFDKTNATPLHPEFIDLEGLLDATLIDGAVTVLGCQPTTTTLSQDICPGSSFEGYSQTGQYTDSFTNREGCDSTRVLNLTVQSDIQSTLAQTICEGSSYEGYSQSGQYTDNFTSAGGCDSIRLLNLTVLATLQSTVDQTICEGSSYEGYSQSGQYTNAFTSFSGCDSIRILNLTVLPSAQSTISQTICTGSSYEGYSQSGQYTNSFTTASGCDSTRTLILTVQPSIETTLSETICEGENYGGRIQSGTYRDVYTSALTGCDSIRTLLLTVVPSVQTTAVQSICEGSCLNIAGADYCDAGTYTINLTGASGCDSTVLLMLNITGQVSGASAVQVCPGEFWIEGGTALDQAGTYSFMYVSSTGCDSLHTLQLSFYEGDLNTVEQVTICEGENYGGRTIAGIYTDRYTSGNGCDSMHTINLNVFGVKEQEVTANICQGQSYEGYSQSGQYIDTFTASGGCDSIRTLNLTVGNIIRSTINATICEGQDFEGLTATGLYENTFSSTSGCDSIRTLTLTVLSNVETIIETSICPGEEFEGFSNAGTYTNVLTGSNGCDSIRTLTLSFLPADDISCRSTPTIDISSSISVAYYPNPVQTQLFIEWNADVIATYSILNLSGQTLQTESSKGRLSSLNLSTFTAGVYYLKIDSDKGVHFAKLLKL